MNYPLSSMIKFQKGGKQQASNQGNQMQQVMSQIFQFLVKQGVDQEQAKEITMQFPKSGMEPQAFIQAVMQQLQGEAPSMQDGGQAPAPEQQVAPEAQAPQGEDPMVKLQAMVQQYAATPSPELAMQIAEFLMQLFQIQPTGQADQVPAQPAAPEPTPTEAAPAMKNGGSMPRPKNFEEYKARKRSK
jgi:hypothetical protein